MDALAYLWIQTVLADLLLCSYKAYLIQELIKKKEKKLARTFSFTFLYLDDGLSLNNSKLSDFNGRIHRIELEIQDNTDKTRYASYLDLHLEIDSEDRLRTKLYDKRDDFTFQIVNFHWYVATFQSSLGRYISQLNLWKL